MMESNLSKFCFLLAFMCCILEINGRGGRGGGGRGGGRGGSYGSSSSSGSYGSSSHGSSYGSSSSGSSYGSSNSGSSISSNSGSSKVASSGGSRYGTGSGSNYGSSSGSRYGSSNYKLSWPGPLPKLNKGSSLETFYSSSSYKSRDYKDPAADSYLAKVYKIEELDKSHPLHSYMKKRPATSNALSHEFRIGSSNTRDFKEYTILPPAYHEMNEKMKNFNLMTALDEHSRSSNQDSRHCMGTFCSRGLNHHNRHNKVDGVASSVTTSPLPDVVTKISKGVPKCSLRNLTKDINIRWTCTTTKKEKKCRVSCNEPTKLSDNAADQYTCTKSDGVWIPNYAPNCV